MSRDLIQRNLPLLPAAFVLSAVTNIVPQGLLLRADVPDRELVLAGMLLVGTLAAMAGVRVARRGWGAGRLGILAGVLVGGLALVGFFGTGSVLAWVLLGAVARFAGNHTTQATDQAAVRLAGPRRGANDSVGMVLRLVGTAAPLALFGALWWGGVTGGVLGACVVAGIVGSASLAGPTGPAVGPRPSQPLTGADRALLVSGGLMFAALAAFAAEMAFLLDALGVSSPTAWAGGLLLLAHAAAVPPLLLPPLRASGLVAPPLLLAAALLPLQVGATVGPVALLACASLVGLGYGAFLASLRSRVSEGEVAGRPLLAAYNDLANVAGLGAFATLGALAWLDGAGLSFYAAVPVSIQAAAGAAAVAGWRATR